MKNLLNLRWLHGSPNQTGETLTRENRLGIVTCLNPMRTLLITLLLLTLGVGQMWAGEGFYGIYIKYSQNGTAKISDGEWTSPLAIGNLTADFKVTDVYLKVWWADWSPTMSGQLHYWKDGIEGWSGTFNNVKAGTGGENNREVYIENWDKTLASTTEVSGSHTITYKWEAYFSSVTHTLPSDGTKTITYTVLPPSVSSFSVAEANHLSGSGTSEDPYILPYNGTLALSISGSQEHTDANSSAQYYNTSASNDWSTTATKSISSVTSSEEASVTVKMCYHNSTASLDGAESSATIYYKAEPAYTVTVNNDGHGTTDPSGAQSNIGQVSGIAISATPSTNYEFVNWTITSGTGTFTGGGTTSTSASTTFYPTSTATIRANFRSTLTNSLTVSAGDHVTTVSGSQNSVTLGSKYAISATAFETGYEFLNWTAAPAANAVFDDANSASTNVTVNNGSVTVTANAQEVMSSLSTSNSYSVGNPSYAAPAVSGSATNVGYVTTRTITAAAAGTGYMLGSWTITNGTRTDGGAANATTITVRSNGDGSAVSVVANYVEDLSTGWYLATDAFDAGTWVSEKTEFLKQAGESTGSIAYVSYDLDRTGSYPTNNQFRFKIQDANTDHTYGDKNAGTMSYGNSTDWSLVDASSKDVTKVNVNVTGTYTFRLDYENMKISVIYPEINQLQVYSTTGTDGATIIQDYNWTQTTGIYSQDLTLQAGKTYTFKVVYNSTHYGNSTTLNASNKSATLSTSGGDVSLTTSVAGTYKISFNPSSNELSVSLNDETLTGVSVEYGRNLSTVVSVGEFTYPTITATIPLGLNFSGWTTTGAIALGSTSASETTITSASSGATVKANFTTEGIIYFDNTMSQWNGDIYVYLYTNSSPNPWWGSMDPSGNGPGVVIKKKDGTVLYNKGGKMTRIGESNIYYYDYKSAGLTGTIYHVVFTRGYQSNSAGLYRTDAAFRSDFNACLPCYIACTSSRSTPTNETGYYNAGYWKKWGDTHSGFTLYITDGGSGEKSCEFTSVDPSSSVYIAKIDLSTATSDLSYNVYRCSGGKKLRRAQYSGHIQYNDSDVPHELSDGDNASGILTTTSAGIYTFTLSLATDHIYMTTEYPLNIGDYRVVLNNGTKDHEAGRIIRAKDAALKDTVSFFIDKTKTNKIYVDSCSAVSPITWNRINDVDAAKLTVPTSAPYNKNGVYNFGITRTRHKDVSLSLLEEPEYEGNFYIRTDASDGEWTAYKTTEDNIMHYSFQSLSTAANYDYYYTKWTNKDQNMHFTIANDYSPCISDTLTSDATYLSGSRNDQLPTDANVRFTWNSNTNTLSRAFISGSSYRTRYLVFTGDEKIFDLDDNPIAADVEKNLNANELEFTDKGNWVYQIDLRAKSGAEVDVTAAYNGHTQSFINDQVLITTTDANSYKIRAVYDFKTNILIAAWLPDNEEITNNMKVEADIMLIRSGQKAANQIRFNSSGKITGVQKIVGAIEFCKDSIVGRVGSFSKDVIGAGGNRTYREMMMYISFPFDVAVQDIFGAGQFNKEWYLQYYDGAERAEKGFFRGDGTTTFWKFMNFTDTLRANVGYSLLLDNDYFNTDNYGIWANIPEHGSVYLYFPSAKELDGKVIKSDEAIVSVPSHKCTIDREFESASAKKTVNHKFTDSHWNMIGLPIFENQTGMETTKFKYPVGENVTDALEADNGYFYEWDSINNAFGVKSTSGYVFKAMHGYMVQFTGDISFTGSSIQPASIVAARKAPQKEKYMIELEMLFNGSHTGRTYVELREEADEAFLLNEDVYMTPTARAADIFTFAENYDVSANVLPIANHIVPVGVEVHKAGMYTLTMPSNFSGTVELVDTFNGERTNLAMGDYSVYLEKGYQDGRFLLEINVNKVSTAIDGVSDGTLKDGKAHKFLQNGVMYILQNGVMYDAQGKRVK